MRNVERAIKTKFVGFCDCIVTSTWKRETSSSRECFMANLAPNSVTDINYQANVEITRVACSSDYTSGEIIHTGSARQQSRQTCQIILNIWLATCYREIGRGFFLERDLSLYGEETTGTIQLIST